MTAFQIVALSFIKKAFGLPGLALKTWWPLQVIPMLGSTTSFRRALPGLAFASHQSMPETTTAVPSRRSLPSQPPAARRLASTEHARGAAHAAREQHPITLPQALERRPLTQTRLTPRISTLLLRIEGEYREMPGLKLTEAQARRLWDLDGDTCSLVLMTLLEQRFLKCTASGMYIRASD